MADAVEIGQYRLSAGLRLFVGASPELKSSPDAGVIPAFRAPLGQFAGSGRGMRRSGDLSPAGTTPTT